MCRPIEGAGRVKKRSRFTAWRGSRCAILLSTLVMATGCGADTPSATTERTDPPTTADVSSSDSVEPGCVDPNEKPLRLSGRFWANPVASPNNESPTAAPDLVIEPNTITLIERDDGTIAGTFTFLDIAGSIAGRFEGNDRTRITAEISEARADVDGDGRPEIIDTSPTTAPSSERPALVDDFGRDIILAEIQAAFEPSDIPQAKECLYTGNIRGGGVFRIAERGGEVVRAPGDTSVDTVVLFRHFELGKAAAS
jgi:hypothetical protein